MNQARHGGDVVRGRGLIAGAALTHRVGADRAVGDLAAHVDGELLLLEDIEVLRDSVSQPQVMPSVSAVPGMSSTPSISLISHSSLPGRTGAKPTPQLPATMVVTP